jgi:TPR repeat protein
MIDWRAALLVALLAAGSPAFAQSPDAADVPTALRPAVTAYRAGDLGTAEARLRALAPSNPEAEAWLGAVLLDRGQARDGLRAIQRAADAGAIEGYHRLALVYALGLAGQPRSEARAVELFEKAASAGHQRAQVNLGILYMRGQGVPRDLVSARAWLEKAAAGGDPQAMYTLGRALDEGTEQVPADPVRAADLYRRAAEKGHALAGLRYGLALTEGFGVKRDIPLGQRWLVKAQENGVPEAALALGDQIARTPATRDKAANERTVQLAVTWFDVAAKGGVPSAQFKLANAYFAGVGIARDPAQAQYWYGRAAEQGLPQAQHALGILLMGGVNGAADPVQGYKWLLLAEKAGHPDARAVRAKSAERLSEKDRKQAEALAQRFTPTLERPIDDGTGLRPVVAVPPAGR